MRQAIRILHLEDDPADAELIAATLASEGLVCDWVRVSSRTQFTAAIDGPYDLILSDFSIPGFDGIRAQALARERRPDLPFVFVSGTIGEEVAIERLKEGATDYVLKQRISRLPGAVRRALKEAQERRERRHAEEQVRRLNNELERRVEERTAQLAAANVALAERQAEVERTRAFLDDVLAASPSMVVRLDPDLNVTYATPNVGWLLGYGADEVRAPGFWEDIIHPDERAHAHDRLRDAFETTVVQFQQEYRCRTKDGHYRWFYTLLRIEYDDHAHPVAILGYVLDIEDRKVVEEELRRANVFLDSILRQTSEAIIVADAAGTLQVFNPAAERLYGMTGGEARPDEWVARFKVKTLDGRAHPLEELPLFRALQGEEVQDARWIVERHDGEHRTHIGSASPLRGPDGRPAGAVIIARDDTDRLAAAEALTRARLEADRANKAKSVFLSRMSHDLRTPLNAILGFAQLIEMDTLSGDEADNARQILRGGRHLLDLINEVLDISTIEAGRLALTTEAVPLAHAIRDVVNFIRPLGDARRIAVTIEGATVCAAHVLADPQRFRQVLLNLLGNAVKYNHYGGTVRVECDEQADGTVRTSITDNGAGISPEKLGLLFEPFERLGAERTTVEGTGLGLALAKGLVEAMGGSLGVRSQLNRGTTFWVDLPRSAPPAARSITGTPAVAGEPLATATGGTVLYVEDNPANVRLVERVLSRRPGVRLLHAPTGEAGCQLARASRPDLILLDLHLPDVSGAEVLGRLLADPETHGMPVCVLSADVMAGQSERLLGLGAVAYLTKPLELRQLLDLVDQRLPSRVSADR